MFNETGTTMTLTHGLDTGVGGDYTLIESGTELTVGPNWIQLPQENDGRRMSATVTKERGEYFIKLDAGQISAGPAFGYAEA